MQEITTKGIREALEKEEIDFMESMVDGIGASNRIGDMEAFAFFGMITITNQETRQTRIFDTYEEAISYIKSEIKA